METRLLVDSIDKSILDTLLGSERASKVELEALDKLVFDLELRLEDIAGVPSLGDGDAILLVSVFCL